LAEGLGTTTPPLRLQTTPVPAQAMKTVLGITDVKSVTKQHSLAVVDSTLG